jgi:hypothetical protein
VKEQDASQATIPIPQYPTSQPAAPAAITIKCPEGSHPSDDGASCIPNELPEETAAVEITLPRLLSFGEPFADYTDLADCVNKNSDKDDPKAYCANIKRKTEGEPVKESVGNIYEQMTAAETKHYIRDVQLAEAVNKTTNALADLSTQTRKLPHVVSNTLITEAKCRAIDTAVTRQILNHYQEQNVKGRNEDYHNLWQHTSTKVSQLATAVAKTNRTISEINETLRQTKETFERLLDAADTKYTETRDHMKTLEDRVKEQDDALKKRKACAPDEYYDEEQGKCVKKHVETPEQAEESQQLKETVAKLQTDMDNLSDKLTGTFKGHAKQLTDTSDELVDDPLKTKKGTK